MVPVFAAGLAVGSDSGMGAEGKGGEVSPRFSEELSKGAFSSPTSPSPQEARKVIRLHNANPKVHE